MTLVAGGAVTVAEETFASVGALLDAARARIRRVTPHEAVRRVGSGAIVVDIRPEWQRAADGEVPGSLVVERNHLEWRLHPGSGACLPQARAGQQWIVLCTEGYTSSLAAAALVSLGLDAVDVEGGIRAWRRAGFSIAEGPSPVETVVQPHRPAPDATASPVRRGTP